jgi:hypothetical protein
VQVDASSLVVPAGKVAVGARFEITGVEQEHAPASISVALSDHTTVTAALVKQHGTVAYYRLTFTAGVNVTDATAVVPGSWTGQFRLIAYLFESGTTGGGPTSSPTAAPGAGASPSASGGASAATNAGVAGQAVSGNTAGQAGSAGFGSGFPAGATGQVAPTGHRGPWWPLIGLGVLGLLGAAALTARAARGKPVR